LHNIYLRFVAEHVLSVEDNPGAKKTLVTGSNWPIEKLKSYLSYCKNNFKPELTESASLALARYFELQRSMDVRSASRTTIRLLESLIRLSQAHAKLMFRNKGKDI
jgi:DNA helicase MCM9